MAANLGSLGTAFVDIRARLGPMIQQVSKLRMDLLGHLRNIANAARAAGAALTAGLTVPLLGAGYAAAKVTLQFEKSLNSIIAVTGLAKKEVASFREQILNMARGVGKGPGELADALYFVTSAGFRGTQAMEILDVAAKSAASGLGETKVVTDALTSALNAYKKSNLDAATAAGVLFAAVREGKAEADAIAPVIGRLTPLASELGISFDQVGAAIAAMTRIGLDAEESATALRAIMSKILRPTQMGREEIERYTNAVTGQALSMEFLRKHVKEKGLLSTLFLLSETFKDNDEAMGMVFENVRGLTGVLALLGQNSEEAVRIFESLSQETKNLGGSFKSGFAAIQESPGFKMQAALASLQVMLVRLGDAILPVIVPLFEELTDALAKTADWFKSLDPAVQKLGVIFAGLAASLGPLLLVFGSLLAAFVTIASGIWSFGTMIVGLVGGPIALLIGAIIAMATALVGAGGLGAAWALMPDQAKVAILNTLNMFREMLVEGLNALIPGMGDVVGGMVVAFEIGLGALGELAEDVWHVFKFWILDNMEVLIKATLTMLSTLIPGASLVLQPLIDQAKEMYQSFLMTMRILNRMAPTIHAAFNMPKAPDAPKIGVPPTPPQLKMPGMDVPKIQTEGFGFVAPEWTKDQLEQYQRFAVEVQKIQRDAYNKLHESSRTYLETETAEAAENYEHQIDQIESAMEQKKITVAQGEELITALRSAQRQEEAAITRDVWKREVEFLRQSYATIFDLEAQYNKNKLESAKAATEARVLGAQSEFARMIEEARKFGEDTVLLEEERDRIIARIREEGQIEQALASENFADGFVAGLKKMNDGLMTFGQIGADVAQNFAGGFASAFTDFITGAKSAREAFGDFVKQFIIQTIQMIIQQLILRAIMGAIFPPAAAPITIPPIPAVPAMAEGGSWMVGGSGNVDSRMVSFLASPNERVTVERPDQYRRRKAMGGARGDGGGGGVVVNVKVYDRVGVQTRQQASIGPGGEINIVQFIENEMATRVRKGGRLSQAIGDTFGSTRSPKRRG